MPFFKADSTLQSYVKKVPLKLGAQEIRCLDGQSKILNHARNTLVDSVNALMAELKDKERPCSETRAKEILNTVYSKTSLRDLMVGLKQDRPFYYTVHSSPFKNIAFNIYDGIKAHQKKQKTGSGVAGWVKHLKWKKHWTSLEYEEPNKGWKLDAQQHLLHLSLGKDEYGKQLKLSVKLKNCPKGLSHAVAVSITKEAGVYYACFSCKRPAENPPRKERTKKHADTSTKEVALRLPKGTPRTVYLDPNHTNFAYAVDNDGHAVMIEHIGAELKRGERQIDYLQQKLKGEIRHTREIDYIRPDGSLHVHHEHSRQYKRIVKAIQKVHRRQREQKKQFLGGLVNMLFKNYDVVAIGNYVPAAVDHQKGKRYNRSVVNRTLHGEFKGQLAWAAFKSAKPFFILDEKGTTRTCHACGYVVADGITPNIKRWRCSGCGMTHHRDENACINGLIKLDQSGWVGRRILPRSGHFAVDSQQRCISRCLWDDKGHGWSHHLVSGDFKLNASLDDSHPDVNIVTR